ncbi:hypothetical protein R1flu_016413 [Riccia fluitans]|uniref:Peroxidase n=1 Tax=Riccia fluitans TaxID=41844 RepID=A0ABD1YLR9_9MARC
MALSLPQGTVRTVSFASLLFLALIAGVHGRYRHPPMVSFYTRECPEARGIVQSIVKSAIERDIDSAAALWNLHYHDCFVRGCDGSILLESSYYGPAEKESGVPDSPKEIAYDIIDEIKDAIEKVCPVTVSCADILTLAARDAVVELGGPGWKVCSGRLDGFISYANESKFYMPGPDANYRTLVKKFALKGLTEMDMVVLSGAHTIGKVKCSVIESSLYNSSGPCGVDPTLDPTYAMELKAQCPVGSSNLVFLDPTGGDTSVNGSGTVPYPGHRRLLATKSAGNTVDKNYYVRVSGKNAKTGSAGSSDQNLKVRNSKGTLKSDRNLVSTKSGKALVNREAGNSKKGKASAADKENQPFFHDLVKSMEKLSTLEDPSSPGGEIRCNCRSRNVQTAPPPVGY